MTARMQQLFFELQEDLDGICQKFRHPKVTLVVRAPELEDGDVVIGNDDLDLAIAAIQRLQARTPDIAPCPDCGGTGLVSGKLTEEQGYRGIVSCTVACPKCKGGKA